MKLPFLTRSEDALSPQTAEQMLANVFAACEKAPNTVPLETLASYSNYRKERYAIQRTAIIVMLALFVLLPLLFIYAGIRVDLSALDSSSNPLYTVSVSSGVPIRQIQVQMDDRNIPVYEISPGEYIVQPRSNGTMNVSVTLLNRQRTSVDLDVADVDMESPVLNSTGTGEGIIIFNVSDNESGVDYEGITLTDPDGNILTPIGFDADAGQVFLPYPECTLNVRIPDMHGNTLQVVLRPDSP